MEKPHFWIPTVVGILLTPIFFFASTYVGHGPGSHAGGGFQMLAFYPIPLMLAMVTANEVGIVLEALQFPIFGFILSYIRLYTQSIFLRLISVAIWFHIGISVLVLTLVLFSMASSA